MRVVRDSAEKQACWARHAQQGIVSLNGVGWMMFWKMQALFGAHLFLVSGTV